MSWLRRVTMRLLPPLWRDALWGELEEEARAMGRSGLRAQIWCAWQALRLAVPLRRALSGDVLMSEIRYAVRSLLRAKGFACAAVVTIVLGLGVNIAVFAVVDRLLFRPLPFHEIDHLVTVSPYSATAASRYSSFARPLFVRGRRLDAIEDMAYFGFSSNFARQGAADDEAPLGLTQATYNALTVLGATPALGRGFTREDAESKHRVALITYEAWQSRFAGAPSVVGVRLGGRNAVQIVGVLPPGFLSPVINRSGRMDGLVLTPDLLDREGSPQDGVEPGVARLRPGRSLAVAQSQFDALASTLDPLLRRPGQQTGPRVLIEPLRAGMFWYGYRYFWVLALAGSLVGLLACANLSALLLARGRSREHEMALRASLGASTLRLIVAEFLQGAVICLTAAAVSLGSMYWLLATVRALVPGHLRNFVLGEIDARVAVFGILAAVCAALISATVPAWRSSKSALVPIIQRTGGTPFHACTGRSNRTVLVMEAAIAVVLVAGAGAMVRNFVGLLSTDLGFAPAVVRELVVPVTDRARYRQIIDVARQQPGIEAVGAVDSMPASMSAPWSGIRVGTSSIGVWQVTDGFLPAIGARLLAGRDVSASEALTGADVVLLTQSVVKQFWSEQPEASAIDRTVTADDGRMWRVIGVLSDIRDRPDQSPVPRMFVPLKGDRPRALRIAFRSRGEGPTVNAWRAALGACCGVPSVSIVPSGAAIRNALEQPRVQAQMFGAFAVIALLLAGLGLFAVVSFEVTRRRYEIGIRMTLGATAQGIHRFVIAQAVRPVAIGVGIGTVVAYWAAQFIQGFVYLVDTRDPWTLSIVVVVIAESSLLAAWLPARRAARTDPAVVLRAQ